MIFHFVLFEFNFFTVNNFDIFIILSSLFFNYNFIPLFNKLCDFTFIFDIFFFVFFFVFLSFFFSFFLFFFFSSFLFFSYVFFTIQFLSFLSLITSSLSEIIMFTFFFVLIKLCIVFFTSNSSIS